MVGVRRIQESNSHLDIISLKNFIMKPIQHVKLFASSFCLAILLLLACNGNNNNKEQQEKSDSNVSSDHSHSESVPLSDNEVKEEAPDAKTKTNQGYALPRHSAESAQSPIN